MGDIVDYDISLFCCVYLNSCIVKYVIMFLYKKGVVCFFLIDIF